ncbi:hypothetical protein B1813_18875 [Saccharomonospora piscinae]|uniref:Uncharacterized protein n=1 Tax=Saccharomonospora piscinae TaxID=687388 RepID=A0A1V8ZYN6_SACPI|nr:hypothetical protein [Saccharomonospora piscinae]OQO89906.1 hypothetical protein B1813_18875 [Saccharomonospora piscinae]
MTWFKVDDTFHSHPKVMATDADALGLWVVAGSWCGSNLTDGFVPAYVVPRLIPGGTELAEKLVAAGLWRHAEKGYQFHDWFDRNPSAEKVKAEREAAAERQRKWRESRRNASGHGGSNAGSNGVRNGVTNAAPTRPDPTPPMGGRGGGHQFRPRLEVVHSPCGQCNETRHVELPDGSVARCPTCHPKGRRVS